MFTARLAGVGDIETNVKDDKVAADDESLHKDVNVVMCLSDIVDPFRWSLSMDTTVVLLIILSDDGDTLEFEATSSDKLKSVLILEKSPVDTVADICIVFDTRVMFTVDETGRILVKLTDDENRLPAFSVSLPGDPETLNSVVVLDLSKCVESIDDEGRLILGIDFSVDIKFESNERDTTVVSDAYNVFNSDVNSSVEKLERTDGALSEEKNKVPVMLLNSISNSVRIESRYDSVTFLCEKDGCIMVCTCDKLNVEDKN